MQYQTLRRKLLMPLFALASLAACGGGTPPTILPPVGITDLGTLLSEASSGAWSISENGAVVVGDSPVSEQSPNAFRWVAGNTPGMELLANNSEAGDVSADGAVVVGMDLATQHAFRWTERTGRVDLGTIGAPSSKSYAHAVSGDGNVVVGSAGSFTDVYAGCQHAFRWTEREGVVDLGTLGASGCSTAWATSGDGSVLVGASDNNVSSYRHAFRWTKAGGMLDLGTFGGDDSIASDVSSDGTVVVGAAADANQNHHAFRWTEKDGMTDLGAIPGSALSEFSSASAHGVSADGRVVTGFVFTKMGVTRGFRWTQATGMQLVEDWLRDNGVDVAGDTVITSAASANSDGSIIIAGQLGNHAMVARVGPAN